MYKLKPITDDQLLSLKDIIGKSNPPVGDHLKKISAAPGISNNESKRFDGTLLKLKPLGTNNNPELLEWLER